MSPDPKHVVDVPDNGPSADALINASGHIQELDRNFRLINICGLAITSGNTWIALGGSIVNFSPHSGKLLGAKSAHDAQVVAIYNGGPPGVLYELYASFPVLHIVCSL